MAGTDIIAQLAVSLDLDNGGFVRKTYDAEKRAVDMGKKFDGVGSKITGVSKGMAGVGAAFAGAFAAVGVGGLIAAAGNAIKTTAALKGMATQVGVSAGELQKFRIVGQQLGVDQAAIDNVLGKLTTKIGQAGEGAKGAVAAFAGLGISIRDAAGNIRPTGQLMLEVVDRLSRIPDAATRAAQGAMLFGEDWKRVAPLVAEGSQKIRLAMEEFERSGRIMTDKQIADAIRFERQWNDTSSKISTTFSKMVIGFVAWGEQMEQFSYQTSANLRKSFADIGNEFAANWKRSTGEVLVYVQGIYTGVKTWLLDKMGQILRSAGEQVKMLTRPFAFVYDRVVGNSYIPDMVTEVGLWMAKLQGLMVDPAEAATKGTGDRFEALQGRLRGLLSGLFPELAEANRFNADLKILDDSLKAGILSANEYAAALDRLMTKGLSDTGLSFDTDKEGEGVFARNDAAIEAAVKPFDEKMEKYLSKPAKARTAEVGYAFRQMTAGVIGSLRGMIDSFKSGDILGGIQAILDTVLNVLNALGRAGVIKGGGTTGGMSYGGGLASGGPVVPGKTYLVGERGPEFITPRRSGFVHPNGSGGGGSVVRIVPSPYFDAVVDSRAQRVAAPMAGRAAVMGAGGAEMRAAQRQRRSIP